MAFRFRGVEQQKGFANLACKEFNRLYCDGGRWIEKRLGFFVIQNGVESKHRSKKVSFRSRGA